jgi:uncharacterized protein with ATP-grasp and redox domains
VKVQFAMQIYLDCIPCLIRQAIEAARLATTDERIHERVVREVLRSVSDLDMSQSPPLIAQRTHRLIRELVGKKDPYQGMKKRFNELALKLYPELRNKVVSSEDRLATAVRLAIAGNVIDMGVKGSLQDSDLDMAIAESLVADLDSVQLDLFKKSLSAAQRILYLADNAGEIVFDRLLIEQLPREKVTVAVKGEPVINDATIRDAYAAGLHRIVEVIENGSDGPGTILKSCSHSFRQRFAIADLVIAKGQGNYESLSDTNKDIFFILKAKCSVIARHIGCEVGDIVLQKSNASEAVVNLVKEAG